MTFPMYLAGKNHKKAFKKMLDKIENIEQADVFGHTLIFYVLQDDRLVMLNDVVNRGANINHQNNKGETSLHLCSS